MRFVSVPAVLALLLTNPGPAPAQGSSLPALPAMTEAEETRLAMSAAPRQISERATILVHGPQGLRRVREGVNGYTCFVEWFERAATMWPVCYEPEAARVFVAANELLEAFRVQGKTVEEFREARAALATRVNPPAPGGLSYRLSPEMWTQSAKGKTAGPWMIMITAPFTTLQNLGYPPNDRPIPGAGVRFGIAGAPSSVFSYYWIDVPAFRDSLPR